MMPIDQENNIKISIKDVSDLERQKLAMKDPLIECLILLAQEQGRTISTSALLAGFPLPQDGSIGPDLFMRAAQRLNLSARIIKRPLNTLARSPALPCILVLKDQQACILKSCKNGVLETVFPETPNAPTNMTVEELEKLYIGYSFFVKGQMELDKRTGPPPILEKQNWFWGAIKKHKRIYYDVFIAAFITNILALANPIFIMNVYDRVLPNNAFDTLWGLSIGVFVAFFFDFLLKNLKSHFLDVAGRKADIQISSSIFERILGMKMIARPPSAGALASHVREFETLRDFFTSATLVSIIDFPFILLFIAIIWIIGGSLAFVPLVIVALVILAGYLLQKPLSKVIHENIYENSYKNSLFIEAVSGLETIKAQAAEGHKQRKWEEAVEQTSLTGIKARAISALSVNLSTFAANISSVGIVILGAYLIADGSLSTGALIACIILSSRIMGPLTQIAALLTKYNQSKTALEQLEELMSAPVEKEVGETLISKMVFKGDISFRNVSFRYPEQQSDLLKNVSFSIKAGESIAVIGAVGSGKTTLQRLLLNIYQPSDGSVEIDGLDVRQIEYADLRRNIGVTQQDSYFFYGSVKDNIKFGYEFVSDEAVLRAAALSGVMDFMKHSPHGLDTQIGERAERLSGGQKQAISIARALLYDPPIMILDEPTTAMDPGSERRLITRLKSILKTKTTILITHKGTLLDLVDKVLLLDQGHVIAFGDKDDVIKKLQGQQFKSKEKKE